jgi:hypothetical protein
MKTNTLTKISKSVYASNVYPRLPMALCLVLFTLALGLSVNAEVERRRTITTFDTPGAGTEPGQGTFPSGINLLGAITGFIRDANSARHAFVRAPDGAFTIFDDPAAGTCTTFCGTARVRVLTHQRIWGDHGIFHRQ